MTREHRPIFKFDEKLLCEEERKIVGRAIIVPEYDPEKKVIKAGSVEISLQRFEELLTGGLLRSMSDQEVKNLLGDDELPPGLYEAS